MTGSSIRYLIKEGFASIRANRMMSIASVFVLLCCMILVGAAVLVSDNIDAFLGFMEGKNEIQVFLKVDISEVDKISVFEDLSALEDVLEIRTKTEEEALAEVAISLDNPDLAIQLSGENNPLPVTYIITLKDQTKAESVIATISTYAGVDDVKDAQNLTSVLISMRNGVNMGSVAIVALLIVVSLVITANTIRLTVFNRRKEISIMKFVGATDAFIRLPFVIEGVFLGLIAAVFAFGITTGYYIYLYNNLTNSDAMVLVVFLKNIVPYKTVALKLGLGFLIGGVLTSGLSSFLFVRKHLRV